MTFSLLLLLLETLDTLISQLSAAQRGWEGKRTTLHHNYNEPLFEFGLSAFDVRKSDL